MLLGHHRTTRRAARLLFTATGAIFILFIAVFALHYVTPLDELKTFVDIGAESNLPTWWNSSLLFLVAALSAAAALAHRTAPMRRSWWVVCTATAYLSLDEASRLHERLARPLLDAGIDTPTYPWLAVGGIAALAGATVLFLAGRKLPRQTARRLGLALACYGAGAVGVEAFNGWIRDAGPDMLFSLGLILEEGLEMCACVIAAAAVLDSLLAALQAQSGRPAAAGSLIN